MGRSAFGSVEKLPSGKYRARYDWPDGNRHKAPHTFLTKADAQHWLYTEQQMISAGTWTPPAARAARQAAARLTFGTYAAQVIEARSQRTRRPLRPLTRQDYEKLLRLHILPTLGGVPLASLSPGMIRQWYDQCAPGRPTTRGKAYDLVHSILTEAEEEGIIDRNPCRIRGAGKPARSKDVDALPADALVEYLDAVPEHYRLMCAIAATCALRSGELRGLRRRDVELTTGTLHIRQQVIKATVDHHLVYSLADLKTAAGRRDVTVPAFLLPVLSDWIATQPLRGRDALLFPARDGHSPMNDSVLYRNHKTAAKAIGRPELTVHDLRRTAATLAGEGGATIAELMRLLGHTTPGVAMLYQVPDARRDRERAQRLNDTLATVRRPVGPVIPLREAAR